MNTYNDSYKGGEAGNTNKTASRGRGFHYTVFAEKNLKNFVNILKNIECKHHVFQTEITPKTGIQHIQGFIYFDNAKTFSCVLKKLPPNAHLEKMHSTIKSGFDYCSKNESADGVVKFLKRNYEIEIDEDNSIGIVRPLFGTPEWYRMIDDKFEEYYYQIIKPELLDEKK